MGFGHGGFGGGGFGSSDWAMDVFYRSLPELHRRQDETQGLVLKRWAEAESSGFDALRRKIRDFGDIRDPQLVRSQYSESTPVILGELRNTKGAVLQRGVNANVDGFGRFVAPTARFSASSIGKSIQISNSTNPAVNQTVTLVALVQGSATTAVVAPRVETDAGPLTWELRDPPPDIGNLTEIEIQSGDVSKVYAGWKLFDGYSDYEVVARTQLNGSTAKEGVGASTRSQPISLSAPATFTAGSTAVTGTGFAALMPNDYIRLSADPSTVYARVASVTSDTTLTLVRAYRGVGGTGLASATRPYVLFPDSSLTLENIGFRLTLTGSSTTSTNDKFEIVNVFKTGSTFDSATIARVGPSKFTEDDPPVLDSTESLTWALMKPPSLVVLGRNQHPAGSIESRGYGATVQAIISSTPTVLGTADILVADGSFDLDRTNYPTTTNYARIQSVITTATGGVEVTLTGLFNMSPSCVGQQISIALNLSTTINGWAHNSGLNTELPSAYANSANPPSFKIIRFNSSTSITYYNPNRAAAATVLDVLWFYYSADRNKLLALKGPSTNNGTMTILKSTSLAGTAQLRVAQRTPADLSVSGVPSEWELRSSTSVSSVGTTPIGMQAQVQAPSLLAVLAKDFGVDIDIRESDARQRAWVSHNSDWIGIKGNSEAYRIIGAISGYGIEALGLWRLDVSYSRTVPTNSLYDTAEYAAGRSAPSPTAPYSGLTDPTQQLNGQLISSGSGFQFTTDSALGIQASFKATDVGRLIHIQGSSHNTNNWFFTIESIISSTAVQLRSADTVGVVADSGLRWNITRLYTPLAPSRPRHDDINADLMGALINPYASVTIPGATTSGNITYTAKQSGASGNKIFVRHSATGVDSLSMTTDGLGNHHILVTFSPSRTADNVCAAISSDIAINALVSTTSGTGLLINLVSEQPLSGGIDYFGIDRFSWEPNYRSYIDSTFRLVGSSQIGENKYLLTISGPLNVVSDVSGGNWRLTDQSGIDLYFETVPQYVGPNYTVEVFSSVTPTLNSVGAYSRLTYDCSVLPVYIPVTLADVFGHSVTNEIIYEAASYVLLQIRPTTIFNDSQDAVTLELILNRLFDRLSQVTPVHVLSVPVFITDMSVDASSTGVTMLDVMSSLPMVVPVQGYFDEPVANFNTAEESVGLPGYTLHYPPDELLLDDRVIGVTGTAVQYVCHICSLSPTGLPAMYLSGFSNIDPTTLPGRTIVISGAATAGNNGSFVIVSASNTGAATNITYSNSSGASDANNGNIFVTIKD